MNPVNILLIEDSPTDALLLESALSGVASFPCKLTCCERVADALTRLGRETFDVVLTDLGLPDSQGLATFEALHNAAPRTPVIVLTRQDDLETALAAIKMGAQDYLPKSEFNGFTLIRTIQYAIERAQLVRQLQDALAEVKTLSGMLPICAGCKRIRDDSGYWNQIEKYIAQYSDATFSHGYCPACMIKELEKSGIPVPPNVRDAAKNAERKI